MAKRTRLASPELRDEEEVEAVMPRVAQHAGSRAPQREAAHETNHGTKRRTRRRKSVINENIFYIPEDEIPQGSSYEWKRWAVHGLEDPFYIASMREQGWEPVDPKRHPNWVPPGYKEPYIIKGSQILMERPIELTEEARKEQRQLSKQMIREAEQRLGLAPRENGMQTGTRDLDGVRPNIVKEIGRMIPQAIEE